MKRYLSPLLLRTPVAIVGAVVFAGGLHLFAQNERPDAKRPRITLRAQPPVAVAPARVVLTAELTGGSNDFEEYYCPSIEWAWGDDTASESSSDCDPYEAGKSEIKRRYTIQHQFRRPGAFKVYFHLKRNDKTLGSASAVVQIQPGATGPFSY